MISEAGIGEPPQVHNGDGKGRVMNEMRRAEGEGSPRLGAALGVVDVGGRDCGRCGEVGVSNWDAWETIAGMGR